MATIEKDLYIISDLHIGDHGKRDNFFGGIDRPLENCKRYKLLLSFLKMVEKNNGKLVLLGDIFDFWQSSFGDVIHNNMELINILGGMDCEYVIGNHDIDLCGLIDDKIFSHEFFGKMKKNLDYEANGSKILLCHGHEYDPHNEGTKPSIGRVLAILAGLFEDQFGTQIAANKSTEDFCFEVISLLKEYATGKWETMKTKVSKYFESLLSVGSSALQKKDYYNEMFEIIIAKKKANEFDKVIVGHSHLAGKYEDWYYNSGSWIGGSDDDPIGNYIMITKGGYIDICDYRNEISGYSEKEYVWNEAASKIENVEMIAGVPVVKTS